MGGRAGVASFTTPMAVGMRERGLTGSETGTGVYKYCENVGYEGDWEKDRLVKREAKPEGVFDFESGTLPFLSKEELVWSECGGGE